MKILLGILEWLPGKVREAIEASVPGLNATRNFEEVLALVKTGEAERVAIVLGAWNWSASPENTVGGQDAARAIHALDPKIPVLVWNGQRGATPEPAGPNEVYLDTSDYDYERDFARLTALFLNGGLKEKDVPVREGAVIWT